MTTTTAADVITVAFPTESSLGLKIFPHRLIYENSGTVSGLDCCLVTSSMVSNKIQMGDILINLESINNGQTTTSILVLDNKENGEEATVHTEISFEENIEVIASTVPPRRVQIFRLYRPVIIDAAMKSVLDETAAVSSSTMLTDKEMKVLLSAMSNPFASSSTTSIGNTNEESQTTAKPSASASLRNWFDSDPAENPAVTTAQDRSLTHPRTDLADSTHPSDRNIPGTGSIDQSMDTHVQWSESQPEPTSTSTATTTNSLSRAEKPEHDLAHPYNTETSPLTEKVLPAGWKTAIDAVSGLPYYYDSVTMTSQFAFPTEPVATFSEGKERENQEKQGEEEMGVLPDGWLVATEATTGRKYYYNYDLNVSQWEAPLLMGESEVPVVASYVVSEGQNQPMVGIKEETNRQPSDNTNIPSHGQGQGLASGQRQEHVSVTTSKITTTALVSEDLVSPTQGQGLAPGPKAAKSSSSNNNHSNNNNAENDITNKNQTTDSIFLTGGEGVGGVRSSGSSKLAAFLASSSSKKGENSPLLDRGDNTSRSSSFGGGDKTVTGVIIADSRNTSGTSSPALTSTSTGTTSKLAAFLRSNSLSGRSSAIEDLSPTATALITAAQDEAAGRSPYTSPHHSLRLSLGVPGVPNTHRGELNKQNSPPVHPTQALRLQHNKLNDEALAMLAQSTADTGGAARGAVTDVSTGDTTGGTGGTPDPPAQELSIEQPNSDVSLPGFSFQDKPSLILPSEDSEDISNHFNDHHNDENSNKRDSSSSSSSLLRLFEGEEEDHLLPTTTDLLDTTITINSANRASKGPTDPKRINPFSAISSVSTGEGGDQNLKPSSFLNKGKALGQGLGPALAQGPGLTSQNMLPTTIDDDEDRDEDGEGSTNNKNINDIINSLNNNNSNASSSSSSGSGQMSLKTVLLKSKPPNSSTISTTNTASNSNNNSSDGCSRTTSPVSEHQKAAETIALANLRLTSSTSAVVMSMVSPVPPPTDGSGLWSNMGKRLAQSNTPFFAPAQTIHPPVSAKRRTSMVSGAIGTPRDCTAASLSPFMRQGLDSPAKGPGLGPGSAAGQALGSTKPIHSPMKSTTSTTTNSLPPFHSPNTKKQPPTVANDTSSNGQMDRDRGQTPGGVVTRISSISPLKAANRGTILLPSSSSSSSSSSATATALSQDIHGTTDNDEILDLAGWRISTADFLSASAPVADSSTSQRASRKELFSPSVFLTLRVLILRNNRLDDLKALHLHSALLPCLVEIDLAYNLFSGTIPSDSLPDSLLRLDISNNAWDNIDALANCSTLTTLLAQSNSLKALSQLPPRLESLDLSKNELCDCLNLRLLSLSPLLKLVRIAGNPVTTKAYDASRVTVTSVLPHLLQLDDIRLPGPKKSSVRSRRVGGVDDECMGALSEPSPSPPLPPPPPHSEAWHEQKVFRRLVTRSTVSMTSPPAHLQPPQTMHKGGPKSGSHLPHSTGGTRGAFSSPPPPTTSEEALRIAFPEATRHLEEMGMGVGVKGGSTPVSSAPRGSFTISPRLSPGGSFLYDTSQTDKNSLSGTGLATGSGLASGFKRISVLSSAAAMASTVLPITPFQAPSSSSSSSAAAAPVTLSDWSPAVSPHTRKSNPLTGPGLAPGQGQGLAPGPTPGFLRKADVPGLTPTTTTAPIPAVIPAMVSTSTVAPVPTIRFNRKHLDAMAYRRDRLAHIQEAQWARLEGEVHAEAKAINVKVTSEAARELVVRLAYGGKGRSGVASGQGLASGRGLASTSHHHRSFSPTPPLHPDVSRSPKPSTYPAHADLWATTLRSDISLALGELKRRHYAAYPFQFPNAPGAGLGPASGPGLGMRGMLDNGVFYEGQEGVGMESRLGQGTEAIGPQRSGGGGYAPREGHHRAAAVLARGLSNKINAAKKAGGQGLGPGSASGSGLAQGVTSSHASGPGLGSKRRTSLLRVDLDDFLFDDDGCYQHLSHAGESQKTVPSAGSGHLVNGSGPLLAGSGHLAAGSGQLVDVGVYEEEVLGLLLTEEDKKKIESLQTASAPGLASGPDRSRPLPPPPFSLLSPPPPPPPSHRESKGFHPSLPAYLTSTTSSCRAKRISERTPNGKELSAQSSGFDFQKSLREHEYIATPPHHHTHHHQSHQYLQQYQQYQQYQQQQQQQQQYQQQQQHHHQQQHQQSSEHVPAFLPSHQPTPGASEEKDNKGSGEQNFYRSRPTDNGHQHYGSTLHAFIGTAQPSLQSQPQGHQQPLPPAPTQVYQQPPAHPVMVASPLMGEPYVDTPPEGGDVNNDGEAEDKINNDGANGDGRVDGGPVQGSNNKSRSRSAVFAFVDVYPGDRKNAKASPSPDRTNALVSSDSQSQDAEDWLIQAEAMIQQACKNDDDPSRAKQLALVLEMLSDQEGGDASQHHNTSHHSNNNDSNNNHDSNNHHSNNNDSNNNDSNNNDSPHHLNHRGVEEAKSFDNGRTRNSPHSPHSFHTSSPPRHTTPSTSDVRITLATPHTRATTKSHTTPFSLGKSFDCFLDLDESNLDHSNLDESNLSSSPNRSSPGHTPGPGLGQEPPGLGPKQGEGMVHGEMLTNYEKLCVAQAVVQIDPRYFQGQGLGPGPRQGQGTESMSTFASPFSYDEMQQRPQQPPQQPPPYQPYATALGIDVDDDDDDDPSNEINDNNNNNNNNNGGTSTLGSTIVGQNPTLHLTYSVQKSTPRSKQSTPTQSRGDSKVPSRRPSGSSTGPSGKTAFFSPGDEEGVVQITAQAHTQGEMVAHFAHSHAPQRLVDRLIGGMRPNGGMGLVAVQSTIPSNRRTTPTSIDGHDSNHGSSSHISPSALGPITNYKNLSSLLGPVGPHDASFTSIASYGNSTVTSTIATSDRIYLEEGEEDKKNTDPNLVDRSSSRENDTKDVTKGLSKKAILQLKLKRKILELDEVIKSWPAGAQILHHQQQQQQQGSSDGSLEGQGIAGGLGSTSESNNNGAAARLRERLRNKLHEARHPT